MNYSELVVKALNGRTVNSMAKAWGLPQPTLQRWLKGERVPDYGTTIKMASEAGVALEDAVLAVAEQEQTLKAQNFKLQRGFVQIELLLFVATFGISGIIYIM
jgi:transcriptional regulator with XRE-family HTH domain